VNDYGYGRKGVRAGIVGVDGKVVQNENENGMLFGSRKMSMRLIDGARVSVKAD
jgi:hypothetical protein